MAETKKTSAAQEFKDMLSAAESQLDLKIDAAKLELSEQIYYAMEEAGLSEAELARRLDVSRAYVNKILKGTANLTIESLVRIGIALERKFTAAFDTPDGPATDVLDAEYVYDDKLAETLHPDRFHIRFQSEFDTIWGNLKQSIITGWVVTENSYEAGEFAA